MTIAPAQVADLNPTSHETSTMTAWSDLSSLAAFASNHGPDVTCVIDSDGRCRYAGGQTERLLNYSHAQLIGMSIWEFVDPDDLDSAAGAFNEASRGTGYHQPALFRLRDGNATWVDCEVNGVTVDGPDGTWMILAIRSVGDRDEVMDRRRKIEALIRTASTACSAATWSSADVVVMAILADLAEVVDARSASLAWQEDDGFRLGAIWPECALTRIGSAYEPLWPIDETSASILKFSSDMDSLPPSATHDLMVAGGVEAVVEVPLSPQSPHALVRLTFGALWQNWDDVNVDLVSVLATTLMSTLWRCAAEKSLHERAATDPLTSLMNRAELYRLLEQFLGDRRRNGSVAVLYGDLDHFKEVNDDHGHSEGDALLLHVADALRTSTRAVDVIARFGGDEFVIVCPDIEDELQLQSIVDRIETSVAALSRPDRLTRISIGRAMSIAGDTGDDLIRAADKDMYRVKRAARSS